MMNRYNLGFYSHWGELSL